MYRNEAIFPKMQSVFSSEAYKLRGDIIQLFYIWKGIDRFQELI